MAGVKKVRFVKNHGSYKAGEVHDFIDMYADSFIEKGVAVLNEEKKKEKKQS